MILQHLYPHFNSKLILAFHILANAGCQHGPYRNIICAAVAQYTSVCPVPVCRQMDCARDLQAAQQNCNPCRSS
eukprot:2789596-Rhodomonas_salina.1